MKILITGSTGLLGQALRAALRAQHDVVGLSRHQPADAGGAGHVVCDLLDGARAAQVIAGVRPDAVIHAQAMSNVDACEQDPAAAQAQNVQATAHVVDAARQAKAALIVISTDYVFDGTSAGPYAEDGPVHPVNVYGRTKAEAERIALEYPRAVVARVSTLFGPGRVTFCDAVVEAAQAGRTIEAYSDQRTSPTYTLDAAGALERMASALAAGPTPSRVYHVTNAGSCTRVEFAHRVADLIGKPRSIVVPVPVALHKRPAPRPSATALRTTELPRLTGSNLRPWDEALHDYLRLRRWAN